jgi:hypothetical protein
MANVAPVPLATKALPNPVRLRGGRAASRCNCSNGSTPTPTASSIPRNFAG